MRNTGKAAIFDEAWEAICQDALADWDTYLMEDIDHVDELSLSRPLDQGTLWIVQEQYSRYEA